MARDEALAAPDAPAYLQAVGMIDTLHLEAGREVEVYDALLRARMQMRRLLGDPGVEMVDPALMAFAERLGPRYDEVRERWKASNQQEPAGDN